MILHPKTGLNYVHVVPPYWGSYVDIHTMYTCFSRREPWTQLKTNDEFKNISLDDPRQVFILWDYMLDPGPKEARKALVCPVYSEAFAIDRSKMLPDHLRVLDTFLAVADHFDAVFCHTPWMVEQFKSMTKLPCFVLPVGWSPETFGYPRWGAPKFKDMIYYGSTVGRREFIIPFLKDRLKDRFSDVSGVFGRQTMGAHDTARSVLYVAHSSVGSFSTWRIWQALASSTSLISEGGDTWPMEAGRDFYEIPRFELDNMEAVARRIVDILDHADMGANALAAHNRLAPSFTVDVVVNEYLIPAIESLRSQ